MSLNYQGFKITRSKNELQKLKRKLTVSPETKGNFQQKSFEVFRETDGYGLLIPMYFDILNYPPVQVTFKNIKDVDYLDVPNEIVLRENQKECYLSMKAELLLDYGGGIVQLETGMGKTIISIKVILESKKRTIIIVPKIELMNQWKAELVKWGPPNLKIGIFQGITRPDNDCQVVIGMLHTISMKKDVTADDLVDYNLAIVDEVHNVGSAVFSNLMFKLRPRYLFGLTATLKRNDSMEKVISWFLGKTIYDSEKNKTLKQATDVAIIEYNGKSSVEKYLRNGDIAVSSMISAITKDEERNKIILDIIRKELLCPQREIILVSDRVSQLVFLNKALGGELSGLFIGSMKREALCISKTKRVLLGTYAMVSEGFNLPKLNCLIFGSPRKTITQAIGRIYRKKHEDIKPLIVDICDNFSIFKCQLYTRRKIYKTQISNIIFKKYSTTQSYSKTLLC